MAVYTTVNDGKTQFNTSLWTGNNAASRDITEAGTFRPGMVWLKARNYSGRSHYLWQEAEGYGANKELVPNSNVQEGDTSNHNTGANGYVSGTQPTGFTLAEVLTLLLLIVMEVLILVNLQIQQVNLV
jgi:hypothetical protein